MINTQHYLAVQVNIESKVANIRQSLIYVFDHTGRYLPAGTRETKLKKLDIFTPTQLESLAILSPNLNSELKKLRTFITRKAVGLASQEFVDNYSDNALAFAGTATGELRFEYSIHYSVFVIHHTPTPKTWGVSEVIRELRLSMLQRGDVFTLKSDGREYQVVEKHRRGKTLVSRRENNTITHFSFANNSIVLIDR